VLSAVGQILPLGIAVAISPPAILAVSLMVGGPRGRAIGGAFALGWILGLALALTVVLLVAGGRDYSAHSAPSRVASAAKLALGALFLTLAAIEWRQRPSQGQPVGAPSWMRILDRFGLAGSFVAGFVGSAFNPKNLSLAAGAALVIAQAGVGLAMGAILIALFIFLGALGVGAPLALALFGGERAADTLEGWRSWLAANNAAIMIVLFLILGAVLIGRGIEGLF
jgi:hypothetical protein